MHRRAAGVGGIMKHLNFFKPTLLTLLFLYSNVIWAHDFEVGGIYYNILSETDKTVEVTYQGKWASDYDEYVDYVIIPEYIDYDGKTYRVTKIGDFAFRGCSNLCDITLPNCIINIGQDAFMGCCRLTSIIIPSSITNIGYRAFDGCTSLNSVVISDITAWCNIDFYESTSNPLYYAQRLFLNNNLLREIIIPNDVKEIKQYAFFGCKSLYSVKNTENIEFIGKYAFYGCINLVSIDTGNKVRSIEVGTFENCTALNNVSLGDNIENIGDYAFEGCTSMTSLYIPSGVKEISNTAFADCIGIKELYIEDNNEPITNKLCNYAGSNTYDYNHFFEDFQIEYMYIGRNLNNFTFYFQYGQWRKTLKTVEIGNGMTIIPNNMFDSCFELNSVTMSNNLTYIGEGAFYYCPKIVGVKLPNELTFIGDDAFRGNNYKNITIPKSVTHIGTRVFAECTELENITVESGNKWYDSRENCNAIIETSTNKLISGCNSTIIPSSVAVIGESAFWGFDKLTEIIFSNSLTNIEDYAFRWCDNIKHIYFESNPMIGISALPSTATCHLILDDSNMIDFNTANSNKYLDVSYTRTLSEGKYGTIILPFAPDAASLENYAFYALAENGEGYMRFEEVATPVANTPYIYTLREGKENVVITGGVTTISSNIVTPEVDGWQTVGSFSNQTIDTSNGNYYALSATDNEINRITKSLAVLPYRAYFKSDNASKSALSIYISGTTGVEEISSSGIDGFENGTIFDLSGRKVAEPRKGNIYIKNGKKIMF